MTALCRLLGGLALDYHVNADHSVIIRKRGESDRTENVALDSVQFLTMRMEDRTAAERHRSQATSRTRTLKR